ncbi:MAG: MotA/TolQ/ExbB proton channel family protein [Pirellulaceae bacterium]
MHDERSKAAGHGFGLAHWWRIGMMLCALLAFGYLWSGSLASSQVVAQDDALDALEDPLTDDSAPPPAPAGDSGGESSSGGGGRNMFQVILDAGIFWVIVFLLLSLVTVFFIIEHSITIRKSTLLPEPVLLELEQMIAQGQIPQAVEYCHLPENESLASEVILAGLERYRGSDFGFAEYKTAVEEAGEDYLGRLYRKTEVLGVIGAVAPMLGLMGTVMGMIAAFNTMAASDAAPKPSDLAGGIGQALLTTLFGLSIAIPSMISFSFFRNKIDSIVSEAGKRIERIMMPLGRKR